MRGLGYCPAQARTSGRQAFGVVRDLFKERLIERGEFVCGSRQLGLSQVPGKQVLSQFYINDKKFISHPSILLGGPIQPQATVARLRLKPARGWLEAGSKIIS